MIDIINNSKLEPPYHLNREEKLKWLMESYGNDVIRIAYSYLKHKQLAEDVAQDVFIKCYEKIDTFRNESSYKTWLIKITVNRCKDIFKSWSYKNILITDFFSFKQIHTSSEYQQFEDEAGQLLSQQIINLPIKVREVIILFYYEELSIEEIADLLKIKPNTIKTRLHRGRQKLKEVLEGEWAISGK
ncbi:RNA polymerase subunit sigma [Heyndrickxia sporothermodurans]|nr:RNA polymerase subunit sigma [Heyndrickxia sporothermodurans]